jgi:hypothetical protein
MSMKLSLFLICLSISYSTFSQSGKLTIHGRAENESQVVPFVTIEVIKDNEIVSQFVSLRNGSYKIDLVLGSVYNLSFKKDGYVEKSIAVIGVSDSTIDGRYFFQLDVELFRFDQEEMDETMLPPVAKLYIKNENSGFTYDKKYVKWISNQYEELEE